MDYLLTWERVQPVLLNPAVPHAKMEMDGRWPILHSLCIQGFFPRSGSNPRGKMSQQNQGSREMQVFLHGWLFMTNAGRRHGANGITYKLMTLAFYVDKSLNP